MFELEELVREAKEANETGQLAVESAERAALAGGKISWTLMIVGPEVAVGIVCVADPCSAQRSWD